MALRWRFDENSNIYVNLLSMFLWVCYIWDNFNKEKEELTDIKDLKQSGKSGKKPAADAGRNRPTPAGDAATSRTALLGLDHRTGPQLKQP